MKKRGLGVLMIAVVFPLGRGVAQNPDAVPTKEDPRAADWMRYHPRIATRQQLLYPASEKSAGCPAPTKTCEDDTPLRSQRVYTMVASTKTHYGLAEGEFAPPYELRSVEVWALKGAIITEAEHDRLANPEQPTEGSGSELSGSTTALPSTISVGQDGAGLYYDVTLKDAKDRKGALVARYLVDPATANMIRGGALSGTKGLLQALFSKELRGFAAMAVGKAGTLTIQLVTTWAKADKLGNPTGAHVDETWATATVKLSDLSKINMAAVDNIRMYHGDAAGYAWLRRLTRGFRVATDYH